MERPLPTGTVTFLFTDVEGSTALLHELGAERYAERLAEHRRVLRTAFERHGGVEVDTQGDAFFAAFPTAPSALAAAREAQEALTVPVRMGLHTGTPLVADEGYVGSDVHRAARIAAAGHGGQVLISAATAALVEGEWRDLGDHRLKDLGAPERIFQLGHRDFPPLKTLYRTNLPVPATPFLGREQELRCVLDLLDGTRLLTLTGPGGTGKTRLALQAAAESADAYPDGVFWVPLAPLRDPALVLEQAAQAVGGKDDLAEVVADKRLLLLLDNLEHLIEAAEGLPGVLAACPNLRFLVTSRELLALPGEQAYPVPPLDPGDGARLFVARARAASPDFAANGAVEQLCARLDNLPLALELAAARVRVLPPKQLLERLSGRLDLLKAGRGVDARQQTLRATIEWSHELLDSDEQRLFARLAVFRGGCTLEAAEAICEADLDTLQSLVDKSLVRIRDESRFWMLETIHEYALERLEASGEADGLRSRHADYFLVFAEEAEPYIWNEDAGWVARVEHEYDNLRAALDWFESGREWQLFLRLGAAIEEFWGLRGSLAEGARRLEHALRADERPTPARAKGLNAAADIAAGRGDNATLRAHAEEALELHRGNGDRRGMAYSLFVLGHGAADEGEYERAKELAEESIRVAGESDRKLTLYATWLLGWASKDLGETERAQRLYEDVSTRALAAGIMSLRSLTLEALSDFALEQNRPLDAVTMLSEAFRINREQDDTWRLGLIASRLARALTSAGRYEDGARVLASGLALLREIGADPHWIRARNDATREAIREQLGDEMFEVAWKEGSELPAAEAVHLALNPGISRDSG